MPSRRQETYHNFKLEKFDFLFSRESKIRPLVFSNTLVILDDLLRITTIEDELDDRLLLSVLRAPRELNQGIVYTVNTAGQRIEVDTRSEHVVQVRSPRWLPIVRCEKHLVLCR